MGQVLQHDKATLDTVYRNTERNSKWKTNGGENIWEGGIQRVLFNPRVLSVHNFHTEDSKVVLETHR